MALLVILVVEAMEEKNNNIDKDHLIRPDDGLQINQNQIWKKIDEVEEDYDEAIAILTEDKRLEIRLRHNKVF